MDAQDLILFVLFRGSKEFSVTENNMERPEAAFMH